MVDMDVHQPPLNTTLMGVIKGAADYYGKDLSVPVLFGRTGHAFALNIAPGLCPSAPYVWNMEKLDRLLDNCGLEIIRHECPLFDAWVKRLEELKHSGE